MAYNDLDTSEMISLFSPYVNDAEVKKKFLSIPEAAGLHGQVVKAYNGCISVRPPEMLSDAELKELAAKQKPLDVRHDLLTRCVEALVEAQRLRALAEDPPNEERVAQCEKAFSIVLPEGTRIINASYRAEAGNTERIANALASEEGKETSAFLKTIPVRPKESALDTVKLLIDVGAELGKGEASRAARVAKLSSEAPPPPRVVQAARSQWINVASLLVQIVSISDAADEVKNAIIHPLIDAAERAGRRGAKAAAPSPAAGATAEAEGAPKG